MKKLLTQIIFFILSFTNPQLLSAQKESNIWYFGKGAGIDFNNCEPVALADGKINGFEGCASISHRRTGKLLFYTNSEQIWNRKHEHMLNGYMIPYGNTITQICIVPDPGDSDRYYVITSDIQAHTGYCMRYHLVDMKADSGYGAIIERNGISPPALMSEKLTVVQHANKKDYWIIAHEYNTNAFYSFLLTENGIEDPVITPIGRLLPVDGNH